MSTCTAGRLVSADATIAVLLIGSEDWRLGILPSIVTAPQTEVRQAASYLEAIRMLDQYRAAVAICDTQIPGGTWQRLLANLQARADGPNLIVSSPSADERLWAEVLNLGGYDVLMQPFDRAEVSRVTKMAWRAWRQRNNGGGGGATRTLDLRIMRPSL